MNIKSLLLGSVAAVVATTGARAADAIIPVEPEPTNFVRVCDVYGSGFFYIPGTETCMSINGYLRFRYAVGETDPYGLNDELGLDALGTGEDYGTFSRVRARLNFDVREETELGTLRAQIRVQAENTDGYNGGFNFPGNDESFNMDQGFIQLGGLTMGYLDTLWTDGDGLLTNTDLAFGDFQANRISYTYAQSGFSAALSLEDDGSGDFAPDVVGRLGYEAGFGSLYVAAVYDSNVDFNNGSNDFFNPYFDEDFGDDINDGDGTFAVKGAVVVSPFQDAEFKIEAGYADDPTPYLARNLDGNDAGGFSAIGLPIFAEYTVGAGYAQAFGKLGVAVSGIYGEAFDTRGTFDGLLADGTVFGGAVGSSTDFGRDGGEFYSLVGNVGYEITSNFDVLGELTYTNFENELDFDDATIGNTDADFEQTTGLIQFVRSF